MMKKLVFLMILLAGTALPLWSDEPEEHGLITDLRDRNATTRQCAANMLGLKHSRLAVKSLIDALEEENDPTVIPAINNALNDITGQKLPPKYDDWIKWWEEGGRKQFPATTVTESELATARTYLNVSFIVIVVSLLLLLVFIMVFSFIGGSKIKEVKEIIKRVEKYIADADGVTQRFDKLIEEIERRRTESAEAFRKMKEETTAEMERFSDLLQENLEHRMREVTMSLREKAEAELKDTVGQIRQDIEREVKRNLQDNKERFLKEVEAHLIFIEGSFYLVNTHYKEALRYYKKAVALKPDYHRIWNNLGTAQRHLKQYDEAMESYQKALQLAPENASVLYNLAATYSLQRQKDNMISHLQRAFRLDGELKDEALNDNAFKEYWSDKAFKDIAEA